jgi:hypothetical protein
MKTAQKFAINPDDPPTFEKVWKMFQETREQIEETGRQLREQMEETSRQLREQTAVTDRQMRETDKKVGELTNRFGDMVEHMVVPNLLARFKALDFTFEVATRDYKIADEKNKIFVEVDAFLQNGNNVMVVEIKATPSTKDVDDHIARMEKMRKYADLHRDTRKYLGAVAGVVISDSVKNYALKKGFFVVVPSGDTFTIIKPEGKYHIREW